MKHSKSSSSARKSASGRASTGSSTRGSAKTARSTKAPARKSTAAAATSARKATKGTAPTRALKATARGAEKVTRATKATARGAARVTRATARGSAKKADSTVARAKPRVKKAVATVKRAVKRVARQAGVPMDEQTRVHNLLADFSTVMFLTSQGAGEKLTLHARPMNVSKLDDDCTLTFLSNVNTAKVHEAKAESLAHVVAQGKAVFLSLRGRVEVVRDRNRIHDLWRASDKVYFPAGKDDPDLCLLVLRPEEAEVWDMSGAKGIGYLVEAARALFSGERPKRDASGDTHDRVELSAPSATAQA